MLAATISQMIHSGMVNIMFRFLIRFVLFGLLFYGIWFFFPDAFKIMVSWAQGLFDFVEHLFKPAHPETPKQETALALLVGLKKILR